MMLQLDPPLPLDTPRGPGLCHLVIDPGVEHHLLWVCFLNRGGSCWTFPNPEIRAQKNVTMGRPMNGSTDDPRSGPWMARRHPRPWRAEGMVIYDAAGNYVGSGTSLPETLVFVEEANGEVTLTETARTDTVAEQKAKRKTAAK
jgi:hypothetical protein